MEEKQILKEQEGQFFSKFQKTGTARKLGEEMFLRQQDTLKKSLVL
jgi:hypothetical protein